MPDYLLKSIELYNFWKQTSFESRTKKKIPINWKKRGVSRNYQVLNRDATVLF